MKHYQVISPEIYRSGSLLSLEPPEWFCCFYLVEAENKRDALSFAIRSKEFKDWVDDCRSDCMSPFARVRVEECLCRHGVCWQCTNCEECHKEWEDSE